MLSFHQPEATSKQSSNLVSQFVQLAELTEEVAEDENVSDNLNKVDRYLTHSVEGDP